MTLHTPLDASLGLPPLVAPPPGYRGLGPAFLDALDALAHAPEGGWWRDVLARRDLVLGVRAQYLNVYHRGAALYRVGYRQGRVVASTHAKYLVRQRQGMAALRGDGTFALEPDHTLWRRYAGPRTLGEMMRAAAALGGVEKSGVHDLVVASPHVIDVEVALAGAPLPAPGAAEVVGQVEGDVGDEAEGDAGDGSGGSGNPHAGASSRTDRLDVAALVERDGVPVVTFHEAKHFTNGDLRAAPSGTPGVVEQIARYRATLAHHAPQLAASYRAVAQALVRLDTLRQGLLGPGTPSRLDPLVARVAHSAAPPDLDPEPRLVVFGFDEDQRDGAVWQGHKARLTGAYGLTVYAVGTTKGRRSPAFR